MEDPCLAVGSQLALLPASSICSLRAQVALGRSKAQLATDGPRFASKAEHGFAFLAKQFWIWISLGCHKVILAFHGEVGWILLCLA